MLNAPFGINGLIFKRTILHRDFHSCVRIDLFSALLIYSIAILLCIVSEILFYTCIILIIEEYQSNINGFI